MTTGMVLVGAVGATTPVSAMTTGDFKIPQVARAGGKLPVSVSAYGSTSCSVSLVGAASTKAVAIRIRNGVAKGALRVPGKPGLYRVKATCGGSNKGMSDYFQVVPAGHPLAASCVVVEKGFSISKDDDREASWGAILRNDSPDLSATGVEAALTFKDAAGNVVATHQVGGDDIPPGQSILFTELYLSWPEAPGATTMDIVTDCDTSIESVEGQIPAVGSIRGDSFYSEASGQVVNTRPYTLSSGSMANILVRNAAGMIVGGGYGSIDSFVLPGGTGTWDLSFWNYDFGPNPTVQAAVRTVDKASN